MNRRTFSLSLGVGALSAQPKFTADWNSLRRHQVPAWYNDAKLGIFIHWGLYSVPAWAPPTGELGKVDFSKWFANNPYAEWYLNSIRLKESQTYRHHAKTYGENYDYYNFAATFHRETEKFRPSEWARLFKSTGARYAVLTTKHHDGFTLWPSRVPNPRRKGLSTKRDLVGDLTNAVRAEGMRMGLYYSGGLDWTFNNTPVATMRQVSETVIHTEEYAQYADAHWRELIDRYQPSILWNDIGYPRQGKLPEIFSSYYNRFPDGLINNRFTQDHFDITTPEYATHARIPEKKWETCRGLGFSFGYNQVEGPEHVMAPGKLIGLLIDIVARNGNLLLNIGPKPDGSISAIQLDRLQRLADWMKINAEAIHDTAPAAVQESKTSAGGKVSFTKKGDSLFALLHDRPAGKVIIENLFVEGAVTALGASGNVKTTQQNRAVAFDLPERIDGEHALVLKLSNAWQFAR
ncbi:MAG: alpha-L-fucosidase [Acidobacteria bacterium]|nr:alpha-L-fucosidase [Acidobacteriota bacterium]